MTIVDMEGFNQNTEGPGHRGLEFRMIIDQCVTTLCVTLSEVLGMFLWC